MDKKKTERLRDFLSRGKEGTTLAVIALAGLLCEIFLMNYKYWGSLSCEPVGNIACNLYGMTAADGRYEIKDEEAVVEFTDLGEPVTYLALCLEDGQQAEIAVAAMDEANAAYLWAPPRTVRGM